MVANFMGFIHGTCPSTRPSNSPRQTYARAQRRFIIGCIRLKTASFTSKFAGMEIQRLLFLLFLYGMPQKNTTVSVNGLEIISKATKSYKIRDYPQTPTRKIAD
jgi:hypothetical protein